MNSTRKPQISDIPDALKCLEHFITGSVRFGVQTESSDIDVVIPIMERFSVENAEQSAYNNGIKFMHNGVVVNVIRLHPLDYVSWAIAAKMAQSVNLFNGLPKDLRYPLHEMLVATAKASLHGRFVCAGNYSDFMPKEDCK